MTIFSDLLQHIHQSDNGVEITAPAKEVTITGEGAILGANRVPLAEGTLDRVLREVGAPVEYFKVKQPQLRIRALAGHIERGDLGSSIGAVVRDGKIETIFRADLTRLTNEDVLTAVSEGIGEPGAELSVAKVVNTPDRLDVELVTPQQQIEVRHGDVVYGGLHIEHYPYGQKATVIQTFLQRLVCTNGMTRRECASSEGVTRTRRLPTSQANARDLQMQQVRTLASRNWAALEPQLEALKSTAEEPVHVEPVLRNWLRQARLSDGLMESLLRAWAAEGSEETAFGLINAVTRVATHHRHEITERERRLLSALGGIMSFARRHVCPRCFSVLRD